MAAAGAGYVGQLPTAHCCSLWNGTSGLPQVASWHTSVQSTTHLSFTGSAAHGHCVEDGRAWPAGVQPGGMMQVDVGGGQLMQVQVPAGVTEGMQFQMQEGQGGGAVVSSAFDRLP